MEDGSIIKKLSPTLFWDVDMAGMDETTHRIFIISRVMDRGSLADVQAVWSSFGEDVIKDALLCAPSLQRKTIFFFANQFRVYPKDFRAYRKQEELGTWVN